MQPSPLSPYPPPGPIPPQKLSPRQRFARLPLLGKLGIGCGGAFGLLLVCLIGLIILGAIVGPPPSQSSQPTTVAQAQTHVQATTPPTATLQMTPTPTATPTNTPAPTSTATSLVEHLTFQGDISGMLTAGVNPHPLTHENPVPAYVQQPDGTYFDPAPTRTQCADFDVSGFGRDYVAVIVGTVGTEQFAVTIEINESDPAYMTPGTELLPGNHNSGGGIEVYEIGGQNRRWQQVYGPSGQEPVIVLHADRTSGTVDAWMASTELSQVDATGTLHLQGDWRCG
jgi:hypothetical protein